MRRHAGVLHEAFGNEHRQQAFRHASQTLLGLGSAAVLASRITQEMGLDQSVQNGLLATGGYGLIGAGALYGASLYEKARLHSTDDELVETPAAQAEPGIRGQESVISDSEQKY